MEVATPQRHFGINAVDDHVVSFLPMSKRAPPLRRRLKYSGPGAITSKLQPRLDTIIEYLQWQDFGVPRYLPIEAESTVAG